MEDFERPYRKVSAVKAVALFVFRRRAFMEMAVKHDKSWVLATSPDLLEKYHTGNYEPNETELWAHAEKRTQALRKSLRESALWVLGSAIVATAIGHRLGYLVGSESWYVPVFQIGGSALLLWAAIWELGWNVRSAGGESLPERVHQWLFRCLCLIGTFLLFLSAGWTL